MACPGGRSIRHTQCRSQTSQSGVRGQTKVGRDPGPSPLTLEARDKREGTESLAPPLSRATRIKGGAGPGPPRLTFEPRDRGGGAGLGARDKEGGQQVKEGAPECVCVRV